MQDGLGLIVSSMAGRDIGDLQLASSSDEPIVTQTPGDAFQIVLLNIRLTSRVCPLATKQDLTRACVAENRMELPDKSFIAVAFRTAKLVIEVSDDHYVARTSRTGSLRR